METENKLCFCGNEIPYRHSKYCSVSCSKIKAAERKCNRRKHRLENCAICNVVLVHKEGTRTNALKTCNNKKCKEEYTKRKKEQKIINQFNINDYLKTKYNYNTGGLSDAGSNR